MIMLAMLLAAAAPTSARNNSLVIARAVSQTNPRPMPCPPDYICMDALFTGTYDRSKTLFGPHLPRRFTATVLQHTGFRKQPQMMLWLKRQGMMLTVVNQAFVKPDGLACFDGGPDVPSATGAFRNADGDLCVRAR